MRAFVCLLVSVVIALPTYLTWKHRWSLADATVAVPAAETWFNVEETLTKDSLCGRPVLWVWFATWCPACMEAVDKLNALQQRYGPDGLVIIALTQESPEHIAGFVQGRNVRYVVGAGRGADSPGIVAIPHYRLIRGDGLISWDGTGGNSLSIIAFLLAAGAGAETGANHDLIRAGGVAGRQPEAPPRPGLDRYHLWVEAEALCDSPASINAESLNKQFLYYWEYLPKAGEEDKESAVNIRLDTTGVWMDLRKAARDNPSALRCLRDEALRRLAANDPSPDVRTRIVRFLGFICEPGDAETTLLLRDVRAREMDPMVRAKIDETLIKLSREALEKKP